jgi:hypothetical protein
MGTRQPGPFWILASFLAALFACAMARAEDGSAVDAAAEFATRASIAIALVGLGVKALRTTVAPGTFAPEPATRRSRILTLVACLALGAGLGATKTAPAAGDGLAGALVGGLGVGLMAYFGAKGIGAVKRRRRPVVPPEGS